MKSENLTRDILTVYYKGEPRCVINRILLIKQKCLDNLELIKEKHQERLNLEEEMNKTSDKGLLVLFDQLYTEIEFELQELWNFSKDARYHRFWQRPKCICPVMDNLDWYPHRSVISGDCPLHGRTF